MISEKFGLLVIFLFSVVAFHMIKLLLHFFIIKLFAQINVLKNIALPRVRNFFSDNYITRFYVGITSLENRFEIFCAYF